MKKTYRRWDKESKYINEDVEKTDMRRTWIVGTVFWGYVLYFFINHPYEIIAFIDDPHRTKYPDIKGWTDEELGIPSDEEGLAPVKQNVRSTVVPGLNYHMIDPGSTTIYIASKGKSKGQYNF